MMINSFNSGMPLMMASPLQQQQVAPTSLNTSSPMLMTTTAMPVSSPLMLSGGLLSGGNTAIPIMNGGSMPVSLNGGMPISLNSSVIPIASGGGMPISMSNTAMPVTTGTGMPMMTTVPPAAVSPVVFSGGMPTQSANGFGSTMNTMLSPMTSMMSPLMNGLSNMGTSLQNWGSNAMSGLGNMTINMMPIFMIGNLSELTGQNGVTPTQQAQPPVQATPATPAVSRSPEQIMQSLMQGAHQALHDLADLAVSNASTMAGMGGGMALASAVCPFAGGAMALTGAAMMANQQANQAA